MSEARLEKIFRHPVKGLRPEMLSEAEVSAGRGLRGDRAFAFQFLDEKLPPELRQVSGELAPWMSKAFLAVQHDWPDLARLVPRWDANRQELTISQDLSPQTLTASVLDARQRQKLADFVTAFLKTCHPYIKARHPKVTPLRLVGNAELSTRYTDGDRGPLSIALVESLEDLERRYGFSILPERFRINFFLRGAPAWEELSWVGKIIHVGSCRLRVTKAIGRCPNIDVDPVTGERKNEVFPTMKQNLGHSLFGMRCEVLSSASLSVGDRWSLADPA